MGNEKAMRDKGKTYYFKRNSKKIGVELWKKKKISLRI